MELPPRIVRRATARRSAPFAGALVAAFAAARRVSAGIAEWDRSEDAATLVARADAALFAAKTAGRNRALAAAA